MYSINYKQVKLKKENETPVGCYACMQITMTAAGGDSKVHGAQSLQPQTLSKPETPFNRWDPHTPPSHLRKHTRVRSSMCSRATKRA